jgi:hypothetical protein
METEKYFGLEFSQGIPLDKQIFRNLAKLLFANVNTSPEEAIRIIRNVDQWPSLELLFTPLKNELYKDLNIELEDFIKPEVNMCFQKKYSQWIMKFSCPTSDEVTEIAHIYKNIPEYVFLQIIEKAVSNDDMPTYRITDFLFKFSTKLSTASIDNLLEVLYNRIVENRTNENKQSLQLNFQSDESSIQ